jgi:hypothetical protein
LSDFKRVDAFRTRACAGTEGRNPSIGQPVSQYAFAHDLGFADWSQTHEINFPT